MIAWEVYKQSDSYENTKKWAAHPEHIEGSLWAAFSEGFIMKQPLTNQSAHLAGKIEGMEEAETIIQKLENPYATQSLNICFRTARSIMAKAILTAANKLKDGK